MAGRSRRDRWALARALTFAIRLLAIGGLVLAALLLVEFHLVPSLVIGGIALILFALVPWRLRAFFRSRMAGMRRSMQGDIDGGNLPKDSLPSVMVGLVDRTVRNARDVTMLQYLIFGALTRRQRAQQGYNAFDSEWVAAARKLRKGGARRRLRTYRLRWKNRIAVHLVVGTPFGWVVGAAGALALGGALMVRLIARPSLRLAKQTVASRLRATRDRMALIVRYEISPEEAGSYARGRRAEAPAGTGAS